MPGIYLELNNLLFITVDLPYLGESSEVIHIIQPHWHGVDKYLFHVCMMVIMGEIRQVFLKKSV